MTTDEPPMGITPEEALAFVREIEQELRPKVEGRSLSQMQLHLLAAYYVVGTISGAMRLLGRKSHGSHGSAMRKNPLYAAVFKELQNEAGEALLDKWIHEASEGQKIYKFSRDGKPLIHPVTGEPYYERRTDTLYRIFAAKYKFGANDRPSQAPQVINPIVVTLSIPQQSTDPSARLPLMTTFTRSLPQAVGADDDNNPISMEVTNGR